MDKDKISPTDEAQQSIQRIMGHHARAIQKETGVFSVVLLALRRNPNDPELAQTLMSGAGPMDPDLIELILKHGLELIRTGISQTKDH